MMRWLPEYSANVAVFSVQDCYVSCRKRQFCADNRSRTAQNQRARCILQRALLTGCSTDRPAFELQLQLIGNEGDELGIGGLAFGVGDGVAEEFLQRFQIAAVPRQLDGVPDGALDARGRRGKRLCDLRV